MTAVPHVTDARSNLNDQLAYAAQIIGKSKDRLKVFEAVYFGRSIRKTATEIAASSSLRRKRVLEEGVKLVKAKIIGQQKVNGDIAYIKDDVYANHKGKVVALVKNAKKLKALPTKTNPKVTVKVERVSIPKRLAKTRLITIDDLDQFKKVGRVRRATVVALPMAEAKFKRGIQRIIGETGKFQDWGGERNDLYTTRARFNGKRIATAWAFKGKGKKGILTPAMMGKNGDQIPRLFNSAATIYLLQYWDQVGEAVYEQMKAYATIRSIGGGDIVYYGIIDGVDSARLIKAYPQPFK
jgi:hypothetical protein